MLDPNFLAQRQPEWSKIYAKQGSRKPLTEDVALLFDAIFAERKEKITIQSRLTQANRRLDAANLKLWVLGLFLAGQGAAIVALFKIVMSRY